MEVSILLFYSVCYKAVSPIYAIRMGHTHNHVLQPNRSNKPKLKLQISSTPATKTTLHSPVVLQSQLWQDPHRRTICPQDRYCRNHAFRTLKSSHDAISGGSLVHLTKIWTKAELQYKIVMIQKRDISRWSGFLTISWTNGTLLNQKTRKIKNYSLNYEVIVEWYKT